MDTKFPEVPAFSPSFLALADVCARELWVGRGYDDGKLLLGKKNKVLGTRGKFTQVHLPDEMLLYLCSGRFMQMSLSIRAPLPRRMYEPFVRDDFMKVARLNVLKAHLSNLAISTGLDYLYSTTVLDYKLWKSVESPDDFSIYAIPFIHSLGDAFFNPTATNTAGAQIALASRLLFFTAPDLPLYNYSRDIATGLRLNSFITSVQLPVYIEKLHYGYLKNWRNLSKFDMPTSTLIHPQIWNRARNAGWWQRRVYDLALVMYFEFIEKNQPIELSKHVKQQFSTMAYTHI
jgi:hypothetical protein